MNNETAATQEKPAGEVTRRCTRCGNQWAKLLPQMPMDDFIRELNSKCPMCDAGPNALFIIDPTHKAPAQQLGLGELSASALEFMEHTPANREKIIDLNYWPGEIRASIDGNYNRMGEGNSPDHKEEIKAFDSIVDHAMRGIENFQSRVQIWMQACFGAEISADKQERNHRFLEEALELVQACGCTASEAHQLVDYVFGRPIGEPAQEAGGVMVTLAALCEPNGINMHTCGEVELLRIWGKVEQIRAKQAAKPKHGPLPGADDEKVKEEIELQSLMRDPKYWRDQDPSFIQKVTDGFQKLYGRK